MMCSMFFVLNEAHVKWHGRKSEGSGNRAAAFQRRCTHTSHSWGLMAPLRALARCSAEGRQVPLSGSELELI
jgi:hypothetical protein